LILFIPFDKIHDEKPLKCLQILEFRSRLENGLVQQAIPVRLGQLGPVQFRGQNPGEQQIGRRGQRAGARIPSLLVAKALMRKATSEGWGHINCDAWDKTHSAEEVLAPPKLAAFDEDNRIYFGTHAEVERQLYHQSWSGAFSGEDTIEKWRQGCVERLGNDDRISADNAILFVNGLIAIGKLRELPPGSKAF
jgi:hypothetical protein